MGALWRRTRTVCGTSGGDAQSPQRALAASVRCRVLAPYEPAPRSAPSYPYTTNPQRFGTRPAQPPAATWPTTSMPRCRAPRIRRICLLASQPDVVRGTQSEPVDSSQRCSTACKREDSSATEHGAWPVLPPPRHKGRRWRPPLAPDVPTLEWQQTVSAIGSQRAPSGGFLLTNPRARLLAAWAIARDHLLPLSQSRSPCPS
jgi:hypothetical protein